MMRQFIDALEAATVADVAPSGVAVSVTIDPCGKPATQSAPQSMPAGLEVTAPMPVPAVRTVRSRSRSAKFAVTDAAAVIDTVQLVLSDMTVCKGVGSVDATYLANYVDPTTLPAADRPEWLSGRTDQVGPTPISLCQIAAEGGSATDDMGAPAAASYLGGMITHLVQRAAYTRPQRSRLNCVQSARLAGRCGVITL